jgi:hypothetical protein
LIACITDVSIMAASVAAVIVALVLSLAFGPNVPQIIEKQDEEGK